jgi:transcriptional regulator with XRE-family HTH domain
MKKTMLNIKSKPPRDLHNLVLNIGRQIKERRLRKSWTQEQLAEASGQDRGKVARLEAGKLDNPTLKTLLAISRALECDVLVILRDSNDN